MIGIDTNILLRYLTEDDPTQSKAAIALIEDHLSADAPGFLSLTVVVESAWVLEDRFGRSPAEIRTIVQQLLRVPQLIVEQPEIVELALARKHADLADSIIHEANLAHGCDRTMTFDRAFARLDGVELLRA